MERSRVRSAAVASFMGAVLLVAAGCANPQFTYVRSEAGQTYFKVPAQWHKVDQKSLDAKLFGDSDSAQVQQVKQLIWRVAFDADAPPSADHLLAGGDDQPFVIAMVRPLSQQEHNEASLNFLRNAMNLPVALTADQRAQIEAAVPNYPYKNFELVDDQELPIKDGVRGVRVVFNLTVGKGPAQTFNQTTYLSSDGKTLSALLIHCSLSCYKKRAQEIDTIAQSFRVRGSAQ